MILDRAVLNARRHRRGNQRQVVARAQRPPLRAQRPKASEGESGSVSTRVAAWLLMVLNARRHRRGNQHRATVRGSVGVGAQRPKASEGESACSPTSRSTIYQPCSTPEGIGGGIRASRSMHRPSSAGAQRPKASEGESAASPSVRGSLPRRAQRPKASEGESDLPRDKENNANECSTPEGIGGGIRQNNSKVSSWKFLVLNARRHRRGNQPN